MPKQAHTTWFRAAITAIVVVGLLTAFAAAGLGNSTSGGTALITEQGQSSQADQPDPCGKFFEALAAPGRPGDVIKEFGFPENVVVPSQVRADSVYCTSSYPEADVAAGTVHAVGFVDRRTNEMWIVLRLNDDLQDEKAWIEWMGESGFVGARTFEHGFTNAATPTPDSQARAVSTDFWLALTHSVG